MMILSYRIIAEDLPAEAGAGLDKGAAMCYNIIYNIPKALTERVSAAGHSEREAFCCEPLVYASEKTAPEPRRPNPFEKVSAGVLRVKEQ